MVTTDNNYPGGKGVSGLAQWIIGKMRTHACYAEVFAGKAAILRNKPPALTSLVMDRDPAVIEWLSSLDLPGLTVILDDAIQWLETVGPTLDDDWLVYLDPPYLQSTRVKKRIYNFEMDEKQHVQLLTAANRLTCSVMISGYPSDLYEQHLGDWHRFETQAMTRGGVFRTEVLWTNYDPGTASPLLTVEYSGLGDNFRERERVSRKINRWRNKLLGLPIAERRALVLSLLDADLAASGSSIVRNDETRASS